MPLASKRTIGCVLACLACWPDREPAVFAQTAPSGSPPIRIFKGSTEYTEEISNGSSQPIRTLRGVEWSNEAPLRGAEDAGIEQATLKQPREMGPTLAEPPPLPLPKRQETSGSMVVLPELIPPPTVAEVPSGRATTPSTATPAPCPPVKTKGEEPESKPVPPAKVETAAPPAVPAPPPSDPVKPAREITPQLAATAEPAEASSAHFFYRIALMQVVANLAGSVLTPLLLGLALFLALRRLRAYAPRSNPLPESTTPAPAPGRHGGRPLQTTDAGAALRGGPEEAVAFPWDNLAADAPDLLQVLGPTLEEERRLKEEEERQKEEAMLRHLFEQNLHLRQQLAELEAAG